MINTIFLKGVVVLQVKFKNISSPYSYIHNQITPLVRVASHHCSSGMTVVPRRKKLRKTEFTLHGIGVVFRMVFNR